MRKVWRRGTWVLALMSVATVVLLMLLDRVQVDRQEELGSVELGVPLTWVTQDQGVTPPLPHRASFLSPWEHPTSVQLLPLAADIVLVALVLAAAWARVAPRRSRPTRVPGTAMHAPHGARHTP